jgi:hypothetical protein
MVTHFLNDEKDVVVHLHHSHLNQSSPGSKAVGRNQRLAAGRRTIDQNQIEGDQSTFWRKQGIDTWIPINFKTSKWRASSCDLECF